MYAEYSYDAWGKCTIKTNVDAIATINPFRYRGYYFDTETGLYYLNARYYDPEVGRFISPDSTDYLSPESINGLNLYAYCRNNPVMNIDPSGTTAWREWLIAGVATAIFVVAAAVAIVATAGTSSVLVSLGVAALTGAATSSTISLATSVISSDLDLGSFFIDVGVGVISGVVTGGISQIASVGGKIFGSALEVMRIGGVQIGSVFGFGNILTITGKLAEVSAGLISGVFFDREINHLLGKKDNLVERIKNNLNSLFMSSLLDFVKYIW